MFCTLFNTFQYTLRFCDQDYDITPGLLYSLVLPPPPPTFSKLCSHPQINNIQQDRKSKQLTLFTLKLVPVYCRQGKQLKYGCYRYTCCYIRLISQVRILVGTLFYLEKFMFVCWKNYVGLQEKFGEQSIVLDNSHQFV